MTLRLDSSAICSKYKLKLRSSAYQNLLVFWNSFNSRVDYKTETDTIIWYLNKNGFAKKKLSSYLWCYRKILMSFSWAFTF